MSLAARLGLGGVLAYAGAVKLGQQDELLDAIREHEILPSFLEEWLAHSLPYVELAVASVLILGLFQRIGAVVSILMSVMFIAANIVAMSKGLDYGCGCFGDVLKLSHAQSMTIDFAMIFLAVLILFHRRELLSIDAWREARRNSR